MSLIRHLLISHNAPYLSPKFCITFVFHFSWVLQPSQEKLKTMLMQNFRRGGGGVIMCIMGDVQVSIPFRIRLFYLSFLLESLNIPALLENHTRFQTKMAKSIPVFRLKPGAKIVPFWAAHTSMAYIKEYPPPPG